MSKTKKKFTKKQKIWALVGLVAVAITLIIFLSIAIPYFVNAKKSAYNSKYQYDGASLVGVWQEKEDFDDKAYKIYEFYEGGRVVTTLYVYGIAKATDVTSTYRIEDKNTLIITYSVGQTLQNSETKFSISEDKSTLVLKDGKSFTVLEKYSLGYNKDETIFGEWANTQNENDVYTFKDDYTGTTSDGTATNRIVYSTNGDNFYIFIDEYLPLENYGVSAEYVIDGKYKIENDTLTLTLGDTTKVYVRR
ncbi:MAG: hypothetical protein J6A54_06790 [Clostridia bacterium]|nr:hypothetical protein [Clostridia bacterium]